MKKVTVMLVVLFCIPLFVTGCDNGILAGIGIGAGGSEALKIYEESLEAKRAELDQLYDEEIARMQAAADPNELAFHKKKAEEIQIARVANLGARTVVQEIKSQISGEGSQPPDVDVWLRLLMEAGGMLMLGNEYRKRRGYEKGIDRLTTEAEPVAAKHIHDTVKHSVRILG